MKPQSMLPYMMLLFFIIASCSGKTSTNPGTILNSEGNGDDQPDDQPVTGWTVPESEIFDGGPGIDGIPAINRPEMTQDASSIPENVLVVGIRIGNDARAYPHMILDWHEIINDTVYGVPVAISYCPLTGSGIGFHRTLNGMETTFGVSGLLYNSNLIPYDRNTRSYWSQMLQKGIKGAHANDPFERVGVVETTMKTWAEMYPDTKVMSEHTSWGYDYSIYPYGSYRTNDRLIFGVRNNDSTHAKKERVHGVAVDNGSIAFLISDFPDDITAVNHELAGVPVITAGSGLKNLAVSFERTLETGEELTFSPVQDKVPVIMTDDSTSSEWDVFGRCVRGKHAGAQLELMRSYIAYWFAWAAFYSETELWPGVQG